MKPARPASIIACRACSAGVNAPEGGQVPGMETLHSNRQSIDAGVEIAAEMRVFQPAGVAFQCDLGGAVKLKPLCDGRDQLPQ